MEIWKKHLNKWDQAGIIVIYLSKGSDTINHSLLMAKLEAYSFSTCFLKLMQNYRCNRFQRTKVNGSFSDWTEVLPRFHKALFGFDAIQHIFK